MRHGGSPTAHRRRHTTHGPTLARVTDPRRSLPSIDRVLTALDGLPHELLAACAREAVDAAREETTRGAAVDEEDVVADARQRVDRLRSNLLRPVLNATGVIVHTNLGRAPIGDDALATADEVARGYSNLEYRMDREHVARATSTPGHCSRAPVAPRRASSSTTTRPRSCSRSPRCARGREVVVSRGELVEIGGGFRVPEIMAESGCRLVEVGTTNRTRLDDYAARRAPTRRSS